MLHGYPPELVGGTELSVQTLARNLVGLGAEVIVIAGSVDWEPGFATVESVDEGGPAPIRVFRLHRGDLYFDHWHKAFEPRVSAAFAAILERERPDVVHVHHWVRLSSDLVATAARCGIPAVVTFQDLWSTCLITFRVRVDTQRFCDERLGPEPCLSCAKVMRPLTPWVDRPELEQRLSEHHDHLRREVDLARVRIAACRSHAEFVARHLDHRPDEFDLLPPGVDLELTRRPAPEPPGPGSPLRLGAWGHLVPLKGADVILEAVRRLADPRAVRVEFAGGEYDAPFAERLRALAEGLDVHFHGTFDVGELDRHPVAGVHAMVTGTRAHESWGLVLDEALLMGIPSVLPDAGALGERARAADFAALYTQGDPDDLARVIQGLIDEPARLERMRAAIPEPESCRTSGLEHARRTLTLYERAVELGPPDAPELDAERERAVVDRNERWDETLRGSSGVELGFEEPA